MTQYKINKAYPALVRLSELRLPIKKSLGLYKMTKKSEELLDFAISEEKKYIAEFNGQIRSDGTISFTSPDEFGKYQDKIKELNSLEVDWDITQIVLTEEEIGEQTISSADIGLLEDFVIFE